MKGKFKWLLGFSIGLNITLIVYLMSDFTNRQEIQETVLFLEVYENLEELEGTIANQIENDWTEPKLVTTQLEETISGFYLSGTISQQLGILSNEEDEIINNIYLKFNNYLSGYDDLTV